MTNREPSDERLDQILAEILASQSRGGKFDPETIIQANPELADKIRQFLSDQNHFQVDGTTNAFTSIDPKRSPRIGNFKLLQRLGEGGMGEVWMADQEKPVRRRVAIKLVKPGMDSRAVLARFDAERQALALMNHPNIAKVFEAGIVGENDQGVGAGRPYFVMELVKGIPITNFCDERRLPIQERLELFRQSCSAVHHAHQKGIIHRDLKPSNILVESHDDRPVLKIIDFGLAKAIGGTQLTEQTLFTALGAIAGTPLYMAPEQAVLNAIDIDIRADVYSLGVLLYELLTGSTPLTKDTLHKKGVDELMKLIRDYEPPKPSLRLSVSEALPSIAAMRQVEPLRLGRFVKGELDWIVMKALSKERERRYSSAMAFSEDIFRFLNQEAVEASPPSTAYMLRKFASRNRGIVLAASAVTGALGLGLVGTTIGFLRAQHVATLERIAKQESVDARDQAVAARNAAELEAYIANISLIQSAIANNDLKTAKKRLLACPESLRDFEFYFLERQVSCLIGTLPESATRYDDENVYDYIYSADDTMVLVHLDQKTIQVFDLQGNPVSALMEHPSEVQQAHFSDDGLSVVTACYDNVVRLWKTKSTEASSKIVCKISGDGLRVLSKADRFITTEPERFRIWDFQGNEVGRPGMLDKSELPRLELSPKGDSFLISQSKGNVSWFDFDGKLIAQAQANKQARFAADANFVSFEQDAVYEVYDRQGKLVGTFDERLLTFSPNGSFALTYKSLGDLAKTKYRATFWNAQPAGFQNVHQEFLDKPWGSEYEKELLVDGQQIVVRTDSSLHGNISLWSSDGRKLRESVPILDTGYYVRKSIAFGANKKTLIFNCNRNHFRIADATTLEAICFPMLGSADEKLEFPYLADAAPNDLERSPSVSLWSESGVRIGQAYVANDSLTHLRTARVAIADRAVLDVQRLDNGISTFIDTEVKSPEFNEVDFASLESDAFLEASNSKNRDVHSPNGQLLFSNRGRGVIAVERNGNRVGTIDALVPNPVAVTNQYEKRIFVADGNNVRVFDANSLREIASFRQEKVVTNLQSSIDGRCIVLTLKDGTRVAWDIRPLEEKQAYWKNCADEFGPSTQYVKELMLSDLATSQLVPALLNDKSLSARRKWGAARLLDEAIQIDHSLGAELFNSVKEDCGYLRESVMSKLNELKPTDIHKRHVDHAMELTRQWNFGVGAYYVNNFCRKIVSQKGLHDTEYERALAAILAIPTEQRDNTTLLMHGAGLFRLRKTNEAMEYLQRFNPREDWERNHRQLFLSMCQFQLGQTEAAVETLKSVKLPESERVSESTRALYDEANSLINGK